MATKPRDYKAEYAKYQGTPEQLKNRAQRNKGRREMMAAGKVHKGDGMDVDHIKAMDKGGKTAAGNLRVVTDNANRSFSRTKNGSLKSQTSKREAKK